jgi:hypothetical protein
MSDREELRRRRREAGLDTEATWPSLVCTLVGARHNRCDGSVASSRCFTALGSRMSEMLLLTNSVQVSAIVRVAVPVASAVARAWGLL